MGHPDGYPIDGSYVEAGCETTCIVVAPRQYQSGRQRISRRCFSGGCPSPISPAATLVHSGRASLNFNCSN